MTPELTVIIPCYNEAERLAEFFALIRKHRELNWEWLFVNDGSTDRTAELVAAFAAELPEHVRLHTLPRNCGKGRAVREGMLQAKGKLVGFVDADLAASPLLFRDYLENEDVRRGRSLLLGIRVKGQVKRYLYRRLMAYGFQVAVAQVTGLSTRDTQCGFKLMSRTRARQLAENMACDGFCFDVELLLLAQRLGMKLDERPIAWEEKGRSRIRPRHILKMLLDLRRIRRRVNAKFPPSIP